MGETDLMWAVSRGSYSDYSVMCVCTSKAEAEALLAKLKADVDANGWSHYADAKLVRKVFSEKRAQLIAGDGLRASKEQTGGRR